MALGREAGTGRRIKASRLGIPGKALFELKGGGWTGEGQKWKRGDLLGRQGPGGMWGPSLGQQPGMGRKLGGAPTG